MDIRNVGAIVTGGASGLGTATARHLAAGDAKVALFDLDAEVENAAIRLDGATWMSPK